MMAGLSDPTWLSVVGLWGVARLHTSHATEEPFSPREMGIGACLPW
jgi:hypothetical protein